MVVIESLNIVGLKKIIKFLSCTELADDLNKAPISGKSPKIGTLFTDSWISSLIKPPSTKISPLSANTVVSISLLFVIKSVEFGNCEPAILETSCLMNSATESDSLICGLTSNLIPISSRAVVRKGVKLFDPNDSPVVIGISWPTSNDASSLSITTAEGVERIFEFESSFSTDRRAAKLSSPSTKFPTPATKPRVLSNETAAPAFVPRLESSSELIANDNKSGLVVDGNLDIAIGVLLVASPEYIVSTPSALADSSDISTMIASTKT